MSKFHKTKLCYTGLPGSGLICKFFQKTNQIALAIAAWMCGREGIKNCLGNETQRVSHNQIAEFTTIQGYKAKVYSGTRTSSFKIISAVSPLLSSISL